MATDAQARFGGELVAGALYSVGGFVPADGRTSWLAREAAGWQPVNCHALLEAGRGLLVDTGVAAHAGVVVDQLGAVLPAATPLSVFLTRAELDCIGNLGPISAAFDVEAVFAGGNNNPFDAFDAVDDARETVRVHTGKTTSSTPIALSDERVLEVLDAPLRLLATYWVYDPGTKTLFTSDSFGHVLCDTPDRPRFVVESDGVDEDALRRHLQAKFGWTAQGDTTLVAGALETLFADREIEVIAPTSGCAIVGADAVRNHLDALLRVLASTSRPQPARDEADESELPTQWPSEGPGEAPLPRALAPGVTWLGDCLKRMEGDQPVHVHTSAYLVVGERETLLVDTGHPTHWADVERQLDELLGGRTLDWIFPTHPELPHAGNLNRLLTKFPGARVTGDVRDYHLYCPNHLDRLVPKLAGGEIDLGGRSVVFLEAPIKDLPSTQWAYETGAQILFVADAFGYTHGGVGGIDADDPVHLPGECGLLSSELPAPPTVAQTAFLTRAALFWSRYVDVASHFAVVDELLQRYPAKLVAPAHGNVISDLPALLPILRAAHSAVLVT